MYSLNYPGLVISFP